MINKSLVSAVCIVDRNNAIGFKNQLLWHIPNELKYFKELTKNSTVIMGRKTYESIGRPLPNRINIVMTTSTLYFDDVNKGLYFADSKEKAFEIAERFQRKIMVIGGEHIYHEFYDDYDYIYLTQVSQSKPEADSYFCPYYLRDFEILNLGGFQCDTKNEIDYRYNVYKRKTKV